MTLELLLTFIFPPLSSKTPGPSFVAKFLLNPIIPFCLLLTWIAYSFTRSRTTLTRTNMWQAVFHVLGRKQITWPQKTQQYFFVCLRPSSVSSTLNDYAQYFLEHYISERPGSSLSVLLQLICISQSSPINSGVTVVMQVT